MAASPEQSTESKAETRATRHRTARFIGVFVVSVLALLTAYRYSMNAPINDWYLFHVAGHTAWALDKIGDRAELENQLRNAEDPKRVRADLEAWKQPGATATADAVEAASGDPLTPWERFQHRLQKTRRENPAASVGPRVQFIWRYSLEDQIAQLEEQQAAAGNDPVTRAALDARLAGLRAQVASTGPEANPANRRLMFNFIVIPECGAIEVMSIFFAAVIAFPAPWKKRLLGVLFGLPIMYLVNIFRLSCLAVIGALDQGGQWFNFAHEYVWQTVYIVFVVMVWLAWVEYVVQPRRQEDDEETGDGEAAS